MSDARARGWGNPDAPNYRRDHIIAVRAGGIVLYVRREVAHLFVGFIDEIVRRGYRLDVNADDWGYNNRDIRGRPGVKSNHAWGLAVDLNSASNPMTEDGHVHTDMPAWVGQVAARWGLFWGANYSGARKDPMHFEALLTPSDVARFPNPPEPAVVNPPPAAPNLEDQDMKILYVADGPEAGSEWLQRGSQLLFLDPTAAQEAANAGAPRGDVQEPLWSYLKAHSDVVAP